MILSMSAVSEKSSNVEVISTNSVVENEDNEYQISDDPSGYEDYFNNLECNRGLSKR